MESESMFSGRCRSVLKFFDCTGVVHTHQNSGRPLEKLTQMGLGYLGIPKLLWNQPGTGGSCY